MSSRAIAQPVYASRDISRWSWSALVIPAVAIGGVGAASGGFFPTSFGWTGLAFAWAIIIALSLVVPWRWGTFDVVWLVGILCLCIYTFVSAVWAGSAADAAQRRAPSAGYLTGVIAAVTILRGRDVERWLTGLVIGVAGVCVYSLATRLLPAHFGGFASNDYRLYSPLGYWNALGIFAAIGLLTALGLAACGSHRVLRIVAATTAVVLAPTLYFTFSRGAWFALAVGTLVTIAASPLRLRLLAALPLLALAPGASVLLASRSPALSQRYATLAAASHAGHRLVLELAILALVQIALAVVYVGFLTSFEVPRAARRAFAATLIALALAVVAGAVDRYGSPLTIAHSAYRSFASSSASGADLNSRLFSFSNDGRIPLWHAAWAEFEAHPIVGGGAGSYSAWWLAHRTSPAYVEYAHNLYLQTLAELGLVGLVLLVWMLGVPLIAGLRARRLPLVAPILGAYVVFLVHAAVDWDWQMPAVTLLALFLAATLVASARRIRSTPRPMPNPARIGVVLAAVLGAIVAFIGLIGNIAIARSESAILAGNGAKAASEASTAHKWAPWSAQALLELGSGRILEGKRASGVATLRQAAKDDPGDWEIWFDLAAATNGSTSRAALERAHSLNPESPEIAAVTAKP